VVVYHVSRNRFVSLLIRNLNALNANRNTVFSCEQGHCNSALTNK